MCAAPHYGLIVSGNRAIGALDDGYSKLITVPSGLASMWVLREPRTVN